MGLGTHRFEAMTDARQCVHCGCKEEDAVHYPRLANYHTAKRHSFEASYDHPLNCVYCGCKEGDTVQHIEMTAKTLKTPKDIIPKHPFEPKNDKEPNHCFFCSYTIDDKLHEHDLIHRPSVPPAPEPPIEKFTHASSSKKPRFELIPYQALEAFAKIFELGIERHKELSWNALSTNFTTVLDDEAWIRSRVAHIIHHAYRFLRRREGLEYGGKDEDDGAAIMFGGAVLSEALRHRKEVIADKERRPKEAVDWKTAADNLKEE